MRFLVALLAAGWSVVPALGAENALWFRPRERVWIAKELKARGYSCEGLREGYHAGRQLDGEHFRFVCETADGESQSFRVVMRERMVLRAEPWHTRVADGGPAMLRPGLD